MKVNGSNNVRYRATDEFINNIIDELIDLGLQSESHSFEEDWGDCFTVFRRDSDGELDWSSSGQAGENIDGKDIVLHEVELHWPHDGELRVDISKELTYDGPELPCNSKELL